MNLIQVFICMTVKLILLPTKLWLHATFLYLDITVTDGIHQTQTL